ncbi:UNVERIFIED_CONTAM: hypothetical protein K2H54_077937 [Gekko kuhli]
MRSTSLETMTLFQGVAEYLTRAGVPHMASQCLAKFKWEKALLYDALEDWQGIPLVRSRPPHFNLPLCLWEQGGLAYMAGLSWPSYQGSSRSWGPPGDGMAGPGGALDAGAHLRGTSPPDAVLSDNPMATRQPSLVDLDRQLSIMEVFSQHQFECTTHLLSAHQMALCQLQCQVRDLRGAPPLEVSTEQYNTDLMSMASSQEA